MHPVQEIVRRNKIGREVGIYSCCSANRDVLKAVLLKAVKTNTLALIEATSNQVNQEGGYTGMTPYDFVAAVRLLAGEMGLPEQRLLLGGDHLGPLPWMQLPGDVAMERAGVLVRDCVLAGYTKIHLDTSMRIGSDNPNEPLQVSLCADRGAKLCAVAEEAFLEYQSTHPQAEPPVYVLGSEVPIPGGANDGSEMGVSKVEDCVHAIQEYRRAFHACGIDDAFERVVAFVTEMGVEFHERTLDEYNHEAAADLVDFMHTQQMAIEGHSTDYQTVKKLKRMCSDGVAILKAGPAFTFSAREALFALEGIECRLLDDTPEKKSNFRQVLEEAMHSDDSHWRDYYRGSAKEQRISIGYSFYNRSRYYMSLPQVVEAHDKLIANLSGNVIPLCMLSQYLPKQYFRVRSGEIENEPEAILLDRIGDRIDCYLRATKNNGEM